MCFQCRPIKHFKNSKPFQGSWRVQTISNKLHVFALKLKLGIQIAASRKQLEYHLNTEFFFLNYDIHAVKLLDCTFDDSHANRGGE